MNISAFARYTDSKLISPSCTDMMVHKGRFLVPLDHSMD